MHISLIIPTYNVENNMEKCIHSAFAHSYPYIEVICMEYNSTDHTWQKLEQLKQQYPQFIINKDKTVTPATPKKSLQLSKRKWLLFLDADDLYKPEKNRA